MIRRGRDNMLLFEDVLVILQKKILQCLQINY
jgi:hypothetical protein